MTDETDKILKQNAQSAIENIIIVATDRERERCARICEAMVIGGRAWTREQQIAAEVLFAAAEAIRSNQVNDDLCGPPS